MKKKTNTDLTGARHIHLWICTRNGDTILAKDVKSVGVALAATPDLGRRTELETDPAQRFELTAIGEIVDRNWLELSERFPTVTLDKGSREGYPYTLWSCRITFPAS